MIRHADWKADACATILAGPRERSVADGTKKMEYVIKFDEPQSDFTDELNGHPDWASQSTTVLGDYLQLLDSDDCQSPLTTGESWRDVDRFYDELIRSGWRLLPLKQLAAAIRESNMGSNLFASTSHSALVLSTSATYRGRLRQPIVAIEYNPRTECFTIRFQQHQGKTDHLVESLEPMTDGAWARIQSWLQLTT